MKLNMKLLAALGMSLLMALPAGAQVAISGLPSASTLGGTELVPVVQAGITSKTTTGSFAALTVAVPNTWALGQVFSGGTNSTPPFSLTSGTNLTSPAAGAFEWDGSNIYITQNSGPTRKTLLFSDLSNISATLGIGHGGTGSTTAAGALSSLGAAPLAGATFTGEVVTPASLTGGAGLNVPQGATPTSPVNGDIWTTSAGAFARINGSTVNLGGGGSSPGWTLISTLTASSSANLTWSSISTSFNDLKLIINGLTCPSASGQNISFLDTNAVTTSVVNSATTGAGASYGVLYIPSWNANSIMTTGTWGSLSRPVTVIPSTPVVVTNTAGTISSIILTCIGGNLGVGSASLYGR